MSGRGRGSWSRGRGSRARPVSQPTSQKSKNSSNLSQDVRFYPHGSGKEGQVMTFMKVKKHLILKLQREFEYGSDIAATIRDGVLFDIDKELPVKKVSQALDGSVRAAEQESYDRVFKEKIKEYVKRDLKLNENLKKTFALIFQSYCSATMQRRLEEHPEFELSIQDDPIKLMEAIAQLMHEPIRAVYPYSAVTEAMKRFINIKQKDDEDIVGFMERFSQQKNILQSHLGSDFLGEFVQSTRDYKECNDESERKIMKRIHSIHGLPMCSYLQKIRRNMGI